jgi:thioesterase domain-containing protein
MAQQLKAQGEDTALLLMIENPRPKYREQRLPGITVLHRVYYKLLRMIDLELTHLRVTHADRRMAYVGERILGDVTKVLVVVERCLDALLARLGVAMLHSEAYTLANLVQKHNQAYADYQPRPYDGRVVIIRARRQRRGIYPDPMLGWGSVLTGDVGSEEVDGPPLWGKYYGEQLARRIGSCLESAQQLRETTEQKETASGPTQIALSSA